MSEAPELVTPEMRAMCREAHDALLEAQQMIAELKSKLDEARSRNLKLEFCLSSILLLAEQHIDADLRSCCAMIRVALGLAPLKGTKPTLAVDNVGRSA